MTTTRLIKFPCRRFCCCIFFFSIKVFRRKSINIFIGNKMAKTQVFVGSFRSTAIKLLEQFNRVQEMPEIGTGHDVDYLAAGWPHGADKGRQKFKLLELKKDTWLTSNAQLASQPAKTTDACYLTIKNTSSVLPAGIPKMSQAQPSNKEEVPKMPPPPTTS